MTAAARPELSDWEAQVVQHFPGGPVLMLARGLAQCADVRTRTVRTDREMWPLIARRSHTRYWQALRNGCDRLVHAGLLIDLGDHVYGFATVTKAAIRDLAPPDAQSIGFPIGKLPVDWTSCGPAATRFISNVGDPYDIRPAGCEDTKLFEQHVIDWCLDLVGAPSEDRWGWVTSGSSEAIRFGMYLGRRAHPGAALYVSDAAHPCVLVSADMLGMDVVRVPAGLHDEMDYGELAALADPTRPAVVVATVGTTMCEAVDDVRRIRAVLAEAGVAQTWVHVDAALSGVPLALDDRWSDTVRLGPKDADSLSISGKFLSTPLPCGLVLCRRSDADRVTRAIPYASAIPNPTTSCSRPGLPSLMLWSVIKQLGRHGLAEHAEHARGVAEWAQQCLLRAGIEAHRWPWGMTVTFPRPPDDVVRRWSLATLGDRAHLIAMPGIGVDVIDAFVADLTTSSTSTIDITGDTP